MTTDTEYGLTEKHYIFSENTYNYAEGVIIYDSLNPDKTYTDEQAKQLPNHIKSRLCMKAKLGLGAWLLNELGTKLVMDIRTKRGDFK